MTISGSVSAQSSDASVRITHASPDAPAVDIWVNGESAITNLAFGEATDIILLPAGSYDVAVTPAGSVDPVADAVISATLALEAGAGYDVVAAGLLANISAQVYPLDLSPVTSGNARLQVIHASPDAPVVDILANGGAIVEGLTFPNASGFLEVPAGSYDVQVALAESGDVALDLPGTMLDAGQVYVVMAIGLAGDGTLTALPLAAPAATASGGEAHTVPATGVGGENAGSDLVPVLMAAGLALFAAVGLSRRASWGTVRNR
jgi:hypothetical protein